MDFGSAMGLGWGGDGGWVSPLFIIAMLWALFWKGLALWHSAKRGQGWWFIILLVVNTVGILEIVYLFAIAKLRFNTLFPKKAVSAMGGTPHTTNE
ncbi:MAG: hypothetical protein AMXMBFR44_0240 [Candidatus Campbellbacteria bacterium]